MPKTNSGVVKSNQRANLLLLLGLCVILAAPSRGSQPVGLAWDPSPDPRVTGYLLHYGTASGNYFAQVDVGNQTSTSLAGLTAGAQYFFTVSAYDANNDESPFSNEIGYTVLSSFPPVIVSAPLRLVQDIGSAASFAVGVGGEGPFSYKWFKNGIGLTDSGHILGSSTSTLTISNLSVIDTGGYSVMVSNNAGSVTSGSAQLLLNGHPIITKAVLAHTNFVGTANTFSVSATGTAPLAYQWQFNGSPLPGATTSTFTLSTVLPANAGLYSVTVTNLDGTAVSANSLTVALDVTPPVATITSPTVGQSVPLNRCTATGNATDNAQVTNVLFSLNGAPFQPALTTNHWNNWTAVLDGQLLPGTNTLSVQAQDASGLTSIPAGQNIRSFFFAVPATLTVKTNGLGTLSTNLDQQTLLVGQNYTLVALPGVGQVFANWQVGSFLSAGASLTFTMQPNLLLQANFIPTPFTPNVTGTYTGLFYETNGVALPSAGLLNFAVDATGAITGNVWLAGAKLTLPAAQFSPAGQAQMIVSRTGQGQPDLALYLQLDLTGGSDTVVGWVSAIDGAWSAPLTGNRADFTAAAPTPNAGQYTFAVPGVSDPRLGPPGNGYGQLSVAPNGLVSLAGNLGDGTPELLPVVPFSVSKAGWWPLCLSLYGGQGLFLGWLNVSNAPGTLTNLAGSAVWIKSANATNTAYPGGFTNLVQFTGSGYAAPAGGSSALLQPVSKLVLAGAELPAPLTNNITLTAYNNVVVANPNPINLQVSITPGTGHINGSFVNPVTGLTNTFNGTLLQNQNLGVGEFTDPYGPGAMLIY